MITYDHEYYSVKTYLSNPEIASLMTEKNTNTRFCCINEWLNTIPHELIADDSIKLFQLVDIAETMTKYSFNGNNCL